MKMKFQGAFGSWMPDLNYGAVATCSQSEPFKALAATADKWINLGVDGFRLDAVKHIYSSETGPENPEFLKQWYDRCNKTFRNRNGRDIYMVGEAWLNDAEKLAPYYKGLTACFEFDFWERLKWVLQNRTGRYLAKDLIGYRIKYRAERPDAIAATILTNHDQTRAATTLNRNLDKLKQAAVSASSSAPYFITSFTRRRSRTRFRLSRTNLSRSSRKLPFAVTSALPTSLAVAISSAV
jgi:glycosidase